MPAPQIGDVLQILAVPGGQAAAFAPPGIAPGSAIGASVVWQPGGVAADNVYTTWPTALAAAVAASAAGMVNLAVDDSLAPAHIPAAGMPAGGWDMQGRIYRIAGVPAAGASFPTCIIDDGATLKNDPGATGMITTMQAGASGLPSLSYTQQTTVIYHGGTLDGSTATTSPVLVAAGVTLALEAEFCTLQPGPVGAELFSLAAGATRLFLVLLDASVLPGTNMVRGAAPALFFMSRTPLASSVLMTAAYTGTVSFALNSNGPTQENADIATGVLGGLTFVVDATALTTGLFTQAVYCRGAAGAVTVQLPDPALPGNKFRQLLIIDDDGSSGAIPIVLTPFAGTNLNGAAAVKNLSSNFGMWLVTMNGTSCNVAQLLGAP